MDRLSSRLRLISKALLELGPNQLGLYGLYRLGLLTGFFRWQTSIKEPVSSTIEYALEPVIVLPDRQELRNILGERGYAEVLSQADEITAGQVRLFGGEVQSLNLSPPKPLYHWTAYELGGVPGPKMDIKQVWEPARFGWAYTLGRAYYLSGDERYPAAFWDHTLAFLDANPPYKGLNWISAQEVALRLMAMVFAAQVFANSQHSTPERRERLGWSVAAHARRIPSTLVYARAQNNNHLLSEAAGLFTAGLALPNHPHSERWKSYGWRWFMRGMQTQIQADGTYCQHSTNYHRLMLQLALWMTALAKNQDVLFPPAVQEKLRAASRWLLALLDPASGEVPNLGPNDGAYILPLTVCAFADFRPVLQATSLAFLEEHATSPGRWDEMSVWLVRSAKGLSRSAGDAPVGLPSKRLAPGVIVNGRSDTWAYLRTAKFTSRPGHADLLHLDLWWRGMNIAQDAGTYLYNAPKPWDNALSRTDVHNTVMVNGQEQMLPAGRFLWLDWANGKLVEHRQGSGEGVSHLTAEHDGYLRFGIIHRRSVAAGPDGKWTIEDALMFADPERVERHLPTTIRLHWLVPDWPWRLEESHRQVDFGIESRFGWIQLRIHLEKEGQAGLELMPAVVRAGVPLHGNREVQPTWGWVSPSYGSKIPALSLSVTTTTSEPIKLVSTWYLP
ncbi:MAG TPA: alginate lyase family protein [Anaerolineales bacterium]|nr:alginate lyase family protein [Anaerolineales bacterium]